MAKITRKHQQIFAATGPTGILAKFGSLAIGSPAYSDDPDLIQTTKYGEGFSSALINNAPPAMQDVDGLCYLLSRQIAYLLQAGISEYSASATYYIGCLVHDGAGNIYRSAINGNINNSFIYTDKWTLYKSRNVRIDANDFVTFNYDDFVVLCSGASSGGNIDFILPEPKTEMKGRMAIVKNLHATYDVVIDVEAGSTIDGSSTVSLTDQYQVKKFVCNGTNWESI